MEYKYRVHAVVPTLYILVAIIFTAGCTVGPNYNQPDPPVDMAQWQQTQEYGMVVSEADISQWWRVFSDPLLNELINRGLSESMDLDLARSKLREARARRGIETASRFPVLTGSGSGLKTKEGDTSSSELYSAGFDAAWEMNIFGRISRRIQAATADLQASTEAMRNVQVSLVAEIALNYLEVRSFQNRIQLAKANVKTQQKTLDLVKKRFDMGLTDTLAVEQAKSNLADTKAQIPSMETGLKRAMNRLAVLLGEKPGALNESLQPPLPIPTVPSEIAVGIPADLLRRRPDIRQAERELAAQTAQVGVAEAELYPHFTFSGTLEFSAASTGDLFDSTSRLGSLGPGFKWNIFNAGSVRNNIKVQSEKQEQALIKYEQKVFNALEEVENAMTAYAREIDRMNRLKEAVAAQRQSADTAESLYKDGLKDFLYVLDAQRTLFSAEDRLAESRAEVTANLIRLYKALGGGWSESNIKYEQTTE